jgi:hypothetical protein
VILLLLAGTAVFSGELQIHQRWRAKLAFKTVSGSDRSECAEVNRFLGGRHKRRLISGCASVADCNLRGQTGNGVFPDVLLGFYEMSSKFLRCTLGVKYRKIAMKMERSLVN